MGLNRSNVKLEAYYPKQIIRNGRKPNLETE